MAETNVHRSERWLSGLVGGLLAARGMRRGGVGGLALAGLGGALIYRGYSGRCGVYQRLGVNTAQAGSSPVRVQRSMTILREPDEVRDALGDLDTLPMIFDHLQAAPAVVDGHSRWRLLEAGQTFEIDLEIVTSSREEIAFRSQPGADIDLEGRVEIRPAPGNRGTELRVELQVVPPSGAAGRLWAPLLRRIARHRLGREMARLKQFLETAEVATSEWRRAEPVKTGEPLPGAPPSPTSLPVQEVRS